MPQRYKQINIPAKGLSVFLRYWLKTLKSISPFFIHAPIPPLKTQINDKKETEATMTSVSYSHLWGTDQ
jgi:hypothetical protein